MRPSRYAFPAALLCAAGLSIGLCFCVITSFAVPVDPVRLLLACFLAAALFSAVFLLKKSWIWLLVVLLLAGAGGYLLRAELRQSLSALVYAVSSNYADAIPGLQAVSLTEDASGIDATLVLILIAALYALLCSWTVMRGEHLAYLLAGVLPVLVLCLVILQTPPAAWAILLVVGVLALLLLLLYLWIFFRAIEIFRRCGTAFPGLLVLGLALLITCQALLHIMVTVNLIPETGQTLPLISRGGSSTIFTAIALGMILSVSRQNDEQSHDMPKSESIYEK